MQDHEDSSVRIREDVVLEKYEDGVLVEVVRSEGESLVVERPQILGTDPMVVETKTVEDGHVRTRRELHAPPVDSTLAVIAGVS